MPARLFLPGSQTTPVATTTINLMPDTLISADILKLEETLTILEELLANDQHVTRQHIQQLKVFYSPLFDFDYSESGSYFYAAVKSLCLHHEEPADESGLILSEHFKNSLTRLEKIAMLSLNRQKNQSAFVSELLAMANLWDLNQTLDVSDMLQQVLRAMRYDAIQSNPSEHP